MINPPQGPRLSFPSGERDKAMTARASLPCRHLLREAILRFAGAKGKESQQRGGQSCFWGLPCGKRAEGKREGPRGQSRCACVRMAKAGINSA